MAPDTAHTPHAQNQLDDLLTGLVQVVADVRHAVIVAQDGLVISRSTSFSRAAAERLAAAVSGVMSLSRGISDDTKGGRVLQTLIEMQNGFLMLSSASSGSHLAVLTIREADIGIVAFEMNMLVKKLGALLTTQPRVWRPATGADGASSR
ncbi:roadblock/LC7 domain-containing protein [Streptomyces sp. NPDC051776]|uniref:roadblock/LC7 domain-containing protein n=1 Tax=Streptomyces sp. NPDC051776 TaxID=3155414 RepID=UPI003442A44F